MKTSFSIIFSLLLTGLCQAQVGINTNTPLAMLDVITTGNTASSKALKVVNSDEKEILTIFNDGKIGIGVANPITHLDVRDGGIAPIIAVGETNQSASDAKAGALMYKSDAKTLSYSNNTQWNDLSANAPRAYVIANLDGSSQTFTQNTRTQIQYWNKSVDNTNNFNPTTGVFTASKTGIYTATLILTLNDGAIAARSYIEAQWLASNGMSMKSITTFNTAATSLPGSVLCSASFHLTTNETLTASIWQNLAASKSLKSGYNNLTIIEN